MIFKILFLLSLIFQIQSAQAISFDEARHLLARTGFGVPDPNRIKKLLPLSYQEAVDQILDGVTDTTAMPAPEWINELPPISKIRKKWTMVQKKLFQKNRQEQKRELKELWVKEMLTTQSPFTEHMTLFWHNHFVSEFKKVKWAGYMYQQNKLLRKHALGSFAVMLRKISKNPAMLIYLDGNKNKKGKPNENFAREVLELFSLGEGHVYTEADIQNAARAFTGWSVDKKRAQFTNRAKQHDNGHKEFLGQSGNFNGDDIIDILLKHPRVAEFISEKIWLEFIGTKPEPSQLALVSKKFRTNKYQLRPLLYAILMSDAFRSSTNKGQIIKAPVDIVIGTARLLGHQNVSIKRMMNLIKNFGQDLMDPPNVKGWPGGERWITTHTMALRTKYLYQVSRDLRRGMTKRASKNRPNNIITLDENLSSFDPQKLRHIFLAIPPKNNVNPNETNTSRAMKFVTDPVFHLK